MPVTRNLAKNLLIVDNSPLIIKRLLNLFNDVDHRGEIGTANDYQEAVKVLAEGKTEIVLLDVQLKGNKGIALLKFINATYPLVHVIVLSNLVSEDYKKKCRELGVVSYLDKSQDFDQVVDTVAAV